MTDNLEPGWYWVKGDAGKPEVARFHPKYGWRFNGDWRWYDPKIVRPAIIGPRLTPPEDSDG